MARPTRRQRTYAPPAVKVGDVIRVHVPRLDGLWKVTKVLVSPGGDPFLVIQATIDGVKQIRTISPRGFEVVSGQEDAELRAKIRPLVREVTLPREIAEELDPREPLPLSTPANPRLADARRRLDRLEVEERS